MAAHRSKISGGIAFHTVRLTLAFDGPSEPYVLERVTPRRGGNPGRTFGICLSHERNGRSHRYRRRRWARARADRAALNIELAAPGVDLVHAASLIPRIWRDDCSGGDRAMTTTTSSNNTTHGRTGLFRRADDRREDLAGQSLGRTTTSFTTQPAIEDIRVKARRRSLRCITTVL